MKTRKRVSITINIPDGMFMALALMAHKQDITLNQLIANILKKYVDGLEKGIVFLLSGDPRR